MWVTWHYNMFLWLENNYISMAKAPHILHFSQSWSVEVFPGRTIVISTMQWLKRSSLVARKVSQWRDVDMIPYIKVYDPKLLMSKGNIKTKMEHSMKAVQWPAQLGIHPMTMHQSQTLLLMLCCACRQEPSMAVLWETLPAADWDRCRYSQPTIGLRLGPLWKR